MPRDKYFVNIMRTHSVPTVYQGMHIKLYQNLWHRLQYCFHFWIALKLCCIAKACSVYIKIPSQIPPLVPLPICLSVTICRTAHSTGHGEAGRGTLDHIKCAIPGATSAFLISSSHRSSWNWPGWYSEREKERFYGILRDPQRFQSKILRWDSKSGFSKGN